MLLGVKSLPSKLSFRWKAIVFIASIEGLFNIMFAIVVVSVMQNNLEEQFIKRAEITARLFASSATNAVLAVDIASLESIVDDIMVNEDLMYARVSNMTDVLAIRNKLNHKTTPNFSANFKRLDITADVYNVAYPVKVQNNVYGQVEIGISTGSLGFIISSLQHKFIFIGFGEILFSALVSFLLGSFLVRRLVNLQDAAHAVAVGDFSFRVPDEGSDELSQAAKTFNNMSYSLELLVTSLEEANQELKKQYKVSEESRNIAEHASKAKTDFINMISHELRTPTQGLKGPFEELAKQIYLFKGVQGLQQMKMSLPLECRGTLQESLNDLVTEVVEIASGGLESANHLLCLINQVLDFAKMDSGKLSITPKLVNIAAAIKTTINIVGSTITKKNLKLKVTASDNLWVWADPVCLNQILINLLGNAIKFCDQGHVSVSVEQEKNVVHFVISDTGCGIPDDKLDVIFKAFEQVDDSMKRQIGGTGLGLPLAAGLINRHGGKIWVQSTLGVGSHFHFTLPANADLKVVK